MNKKDSRRSRKPPDRGVSRRGFFQAVGLGGAAATLIEGCAAGKVSAAPAEALGPEAVPITLKVNGGSVKMKVEPRVTLLDALRDHLKLDSTEHVDLTGSKRVCDRGSCGACTMIVDGRTAYSCSMLAVEAQGREIRTVESLEKGGQLHPVQEEFIACDGMMCGFCTPGFVMAGVACLERHAEPTRDQIRKCLDGNICRCGTQPRALEAVEKASKRMKGRR
jgi:xanthine dehydrogenase YagT iron-sulfur-binding subunit